jgi:hypothetical protein
MMENGMMEIMNRRYKILFLLSVLMIVSFNQLFAQIGDKLSPLQYSVQTYEIQMGDSLNTPSWDIYIGGTTKEQIENGTATKLVDGTNYTWKKPLVKSGGKSYFKVQFSVVIGGVSVPTPQGPYVVGYKETTSDGLSCISAVVKSIHLYGPFDVDLSLKNPGDAATCPDGSNVPKLPGTLVFYDTVQYLVTMTYPGLTEGGYNASGTWNFSFTVAPVVEQSGKNDTIVSITATGSGMDNITWGAATGKIKYTGSCTISPATVTPVTFIVIFKDILGQNQNISFSLNYIIGANSEPDIDEISNTPGNSLTHQIYAMPGGSSISAWN